MMGGALAVKCKDLRVLVLDIYGVEEFNNIAYTLETLSNVGQLDVPDAPESSFADLCITCIAVTVIESCYACCRAILVFITLSSVISDLRPLHSRAFP